MNLCYNGSVAGAERGGKMKAIRCIYKDGIRKEATDRRMHRWFLCPLKNVEVGDYVLVEYKIQRKNKETGNKISDRFFGVQKVNKIIDHIEYDKLFLEKRKPRNFVVCKIPGKNMEELGRDALQNRKSLIHFYQGRDAFNPQWRILKVRHRRDIKQKMDRPGKLYYFVSLIDDLKVGNYVLVEYRKCYPKISKRKSFREGEIAETNHFSVARIEEFVETNEMSMRDICPIAFVVTRLPKIDFDKRIEEVKKFKRLYNDRYRHKVPYAERIEKKKPKKGGGRRRFRSVITSWSSDKKKQ